MELTYAQMSIAGPVRKRNEDTLGFWHPPSPELVRSLGIAAVIADGVGGTGRGEEASQLAVHSALTALKNAPVDTAPADLLRMMVNEANQAVYDEAHRTPDQGRMATTFTASIFRHDELSVAHVGDSRIYLVRKGTVKRVTSDHSYVSLQVKLGLLKEQDAMGSPMRSVITRSLGNELICGYDFIRETLSKGDVIVQCTDGLYAHMGDDEMREIASHGGPEQVCSELVALAEKRLSDDNISVQVIRIDEVEHVHYYRGAPYYVKGGDKPAGSEVQAGDVLDERFEITDLINRSGMASIFKANDRKSGQIVAVKIPLMQFESDMASFSRFQREEEIGQSLNHPYLLKIFPVEERKSRPYIVMELLQGQTLDALMKQVSPLPEPDAARIASRICEALEYMHNHDVVHRDLKPQNIMLCTDGTIRIMDFGIAKSSKARRLTFVGFSPTMGTPDYMAPEQVKGKRGDERTDIYALGAILYEMATGTTPFEGETPYAIMNARVTGDPVAPRKVNTKLTPTLEEIILHAMERNPAERFPNAAAMKAELDDYEKVELVGRYKNLQKPQIWKSRFQKLPLIIALLIGQIVLFFIMFWFLKNHKR
jgi:serine/threonine protein phosphatase PrpC